MADMPLECVLMLAYALALVLIALVLERIAGHAHQRSLSVSTDGFTYHSDQDIWKCPKDQHLFPVFSDSGKGKVIYRAPASACNACPSKAVCTDSDHGREIERNVCDIEHGIKQFHRAVSLTLLLLASLILVVELFRIDGIYPRIVLIATLMSIGVFTLRLAEALTTKARLKAE